MPRGDNPNSRANLKPFGTLPEKEQRKIQEKGVKASVESRKTLGTFKAAYKRTMSDEDLDAILEKVREMAKKGNLNALDRLLQISGENRDQTTDDDDQVMKFIKAMRGEE